MRRRLFFASLLIITIVLLSGCGLLLGDSSCEEHIDENEDFVCDRCEEEIPCRHTFEEEYSYDSYFHWYASTCGHTEEKSGYDSHYYDSYEIIKEPTCAEGGSQRGVCACGYVNDIYLSPLTHPEDMNTYEYDEYFHWHPTTCGHENYSHRKNGHTWNEGTVTKAGTCLEKEEITKACYCGATKLEYGNYGGHLIATEFTATEDGHYYEYLCGHTQYQIVYSHRLKGRYNFKEPTCTEDGESRRECFDCSYYSSRVEPATGHSFETVYEYTATHHWLPSTCGHEEETSDYGEHSFAKDLSCKCGYKKVPNDGIAYEFINNYTQYRVVGLENEALTEIVIPNELFGLPVTEIKNSAFEGNTSITSLSLGKNVATIGDNAFFGCASLESITVNEENETYRSEENTLISRSDSTLLLASKNAKIPEGVSKIASYAFYNLTIDGTFVVPANVTEIGASAFEGLKCDRAEISCAGTTGEFAFRNSTLTQLALGSEITEIGRGSFYGCTGLVKLQLPGTIQTIKDSAFYGCAGIDEIKFNGNVNVGSNAFYGCTGAKALSLVGGTIDENAFFGCTGITTLSVPSGITAELGAFAGLSNLEELTVVYLSTVKIDGVGATHIGAFFGEDSYEGSYSAFGYCIPSTLKKLSVTGKTELYENAFASCRSLVEVEISQATRLAKKMFTSCSALETLYLPFLGRTYYNDERYTFEDLMGTGTNVKHLTIGGTYDIAERAFFDYTSLQTINLPDTLVKIGKMAFYKCTGLTELEIPASLRFIEQDAFDFTDIERVYITDIAAWCDISLYSYSESLTYCGATLYLNGSEIAGDIVIPNGPTRVGAGAFYGCEKITSVSIPSSVDIIESLAFEGCTGLEKVSLSYGLDEICSNAFTETKIRELVIPNSVRIIGYMAFSDCRELVKATLGISVANVGALAFDRCYRLTEVYKLSSYSIDVLPGFGYDGIELYASVIHTGSSEASVLCEDENGFIFALLDGKYYLVTNHEIEGEVTLPETINGNTYDIRSYAFYGKNITSVQLPDGIRVLGDLAFADTCITEINLNKVETVGASCFYASAIESLVITEAVTSIGGGAFSSCTALTDVDWQTTGEIELGSGLFESSRALEKIVVPSVVTVVPAKTFFDCTALSDVTLSPSTTRINYLAFSLCTQLNEISLPSTLTYLESSVFSGAGLTTISLPVGVYSISDGCFEDCASLESVYYSSAVLDISGSGFKNATALTTINMSKIRRVDSEGFYGCKNLKITLSSILLSIGDRAYYECIYTDSTLTVPSTVYAIGTEAFSSWRHLEKIIFEGDSVSYLGDGAFKDLFNIKSITIPTVKESMGEGIFAGCYGLESITVPFVGANKNGTKEESERETTIAYLFGQEAYDNCYLVEIPYMLNKTTCVTINAYLPSSLKKVVITEQVAIGKYAFYGSSLNTIILPSTLESIGEYAFSWCESLASITIPGSTNKIAPFAFYKCTLLGRIYFEKPTSWFMLNETIWQLKDLTDPAAAKDYFVVTDCDSEWQRNEEND
ncbi:MAG: leucine-rich repeat protein [Clostridia bacterium]|nr:leucine-rich repeat protein [Clostridia bacterium]